MFMLSLCLSLTLLGLAGLHLLWALGYWFPLRDERALARAVVGTRGIVEMPSAAACSVMVVALFFAVAWPWLVATWITTLGLAGIALVFLLRGVAAYVPAFRRMVPEEPFATYDRRAYGPLCLALGAGFLTLTYGALT